MSKLEQLLQKLCPDGVEYKKISEVSSVLRGKRITKNQLSSDNLYPVYHGGLEPLGYYDKWNREAGKVMIINVGASAGTVGSCDTEFWSSDGCFCIDKALEINDKYLYHYLKNNESYFQAKVRKAGIPTLDNYIVEDFKIPVPPLEIQQEIVNILDTFTELTTELITELTARKKQYEYYRDHLLSFDDHGGATSSVVSYTLGELFDFKNGINKGKEFFGKGTPIVNFTDVFHKGKLTVNNIPGRVEVTEDEIWRYGVKRGDVFFTRTSETKEEIGMASVLVEDIPNCIFSGFVLRARPTTDLLLPEYCAYCFSTTHIRKEIVRYASFTTRALTSGSILSKIKINIPPLDVQKRLVHILDNFDAICSDLKIGLPAEIEARRKQYEYYRDKLLTFTPKKES
ncbi:restriction endonuclease subunit S [Akkermansia sp.]|uniref:restriction endonuclease subunit S n=1 Tax=Akkermansia sp. TaxID=1872421 RepID=UPI0025C1A71A|nr:restriction endonuclease subunit S [Akkermansia sp.]